VTGRHVLVTGVVGGIGAACAVAFAENGDQVTGVDARGDELHAFMKILADRYGVDTHGLAAELGDPGCGELVTRAAEDVGPVDVLVNAAGIYPATPLREMTAVAWDRVQAVNVRAPMLLTVALAAQGRAATVVNISSGASTRACPGAAHYCTSKAALEMATKACAVELAADGIRVNAVAPGFVTVDSPVNPVTREYRDKVSRNPLGRSGNPSEIAAAVLWLASDAASFTTGAVIRVDGGATAGTTDLPTQLPHHDTAADQRDWSAVTHHAVPTRAEADAGPHHYTVVGAGAIGGTLGHHLARAGHHVTLVDADATHITAIRKEGLAVVRDAERTVVQVAAALSPGDPDEDDLGPLQRVILAVKAQATGKALDWIAPRLAPDGYVVSLQNGLNESAIARRVGADRTVGAFVNLFADAIGPGEIRDGGRGALVVGEMDGTESARVASVVEDLQAWGPAKATTNVPGYLWSKLGFGAMLTATALADAPMAELIDRHRALMHRLAGEVFAVAATQGIALESFDAFDPAPYAGDDEAAKQQATGRLVAWLATQAKDRSGIWRDIAVRRRPTEVPTHYGEVLRVAQTAGVPTPLLANLLDQIHELEQGGSMSEDRLDTLATVVA
jgi:2-dehydropantoate 2-reductase